MFLCEQNYREAGDVHMQFKWCGIWPLNTEKDTKGNS